MPDILSLPIVIDWFEFVITKVESPEPWKNVNS